MVYDKNGKMINSSKKPIKSSVASGLRIANVTVYPKWICETVRSTIYVGANINGKDFVFPMMPCYGNTPDGVDCDECLMTKLNGGWGGHADYDRYAERINHVAKGGSSKAYGLNIMSDVLKSAPKENQKDFGFTGQYYSTKNVPRAFKSKLMELYNNGSLEPEFLEAIGLGTITSSKTITSNKEPADMDMAYQLEGYIESDGQLYTQMIVPVIKNLERKVKKGIYDYDKSLILWQHVADEGAKRYVKELGGPAYNVATRKEVAKKLSSYYEENYMGDNPIESSKQIKSTVDFPQDGNEFANLIDKVLDEHHIGNSGAYFIPRRNVFDVTINGDWKHDHLAADYFLFHELGLSCIDTREIGDSDSDWYEAVHTYQRNADLENLKKQLS